MLRQMIPVKYLEIALKDLTTPKNKKLHSSKYIESESNTHRYVFECFIIPNDDVNEWYIKDFYSFSLTEKELRKKKLKKLIN